MGILTTETPSLRSILSSSFVVTPKNVFSINGKTYAKVFLYSKTRHPFLVKGKNFFIDGFKEKNHSRS